jgi:hypothetical protein
VHLRTIAMLIDQTDVASSQYQAFLTAKAGNTAGQSVRVVAKCSARRTANLRDHRSRRRTSREVENVEGGTTGAMFRACDPLTKRLYAALGSYRRRLHQLRFQFLESPSEPLVWRVGNVGPRGIL